MDLVAHKIIRNGRKIKLGPKEFKLLKTFSSNLKEFLVETNY